MFSPDPQAAAESYWDPAFADWIPEGTDRHATRDELYTIKVSHSYWELENGSWEKHIMDAMRLKGVGAQLIPSLHRMLYRVWSSEHGRKRVKLDQDAPDFFADAVTRRYDHDSIHASVAYGDRPLYESVLVDGASVAIDMSKVRALSFADQVRLYREEVYATALERLIIPSGYRQSPRAAYAWALRRTITSLTRGWSARFLVEHYDVFRAPDVDYVKWHKANGHKLILIGH
ncbi:hypothetical protein JOD54_002153 [Actinokineospora baliensis]|uniref:DUF7275 domain-containing protein n=1 Tax=Actinokineospora baliensis TaxID=547056 RepID=UPI00195DA3B6|nr:hypothetical protein [Actinokineospora baliensis]MBM7771949.1 hypothetical protein [Actinokineospora baliensis]